MAKKDNIIEEIIETGFEISGNVTGGVIGSLVAGPVGGIIGGASGPIITRLFKVIGKEIKERDLSPREGAKIGAAYFYALQRILKNESKGLTLRSDDFFQTKVNQRAGSEEILEGILISSQREFEELKLMYLGNLYANICFRDDVTREFASQLIKTANNLSYRQFCLLELLRQKVKNNTELIFKVPSLEKWEISQFDIVVELRDLDQRGHIHIPSTFDGGNNSNPIKLEHLNITTIGLFFCEMLSLEEIDEKDLKKLNDQTTILE